MAPPHGADTTTASARRPAPRIIPAIPRRFARPSTAARPITPDGSAGAPAPVLTPKSVETKQKNSERTATPVQTPPTPDSKASPSTNGDGEAQAPSKSPALSTDHEGAGETATATATADTLTAHEQNNMPNKETEQDNAQGPPAISKPAPDAAAPNRHRPKSTLRTELPPEFYPREKPRVTSPFDDGREPSLHHVSAHRFQPSVEGIIFGGAVQESPAMPSTPQEFEHDMRASQSAFTRPPPGFAPHLAPQFFPGHSHHPSDPAAPWLQPAYSMPPPPEAMFGNGQDFTSPTFAPGSALFQAPFPTPFHPTPAPLAPNGTTSSHSQSPSKSQFEETKPAPYLEDDSAAPFTNGNTSRRFETPNQAHDIAHHVFGLFGNPEFTDYILHVRFQDTGISLPVHAAIVSRSPVILDAIRRSASPTFQTKDPRRLAEVVINDMFVSPESLHEAIKILYGAPLLAPQSFLFGLSPYVGGNEQGVVSDEARMRLTQLISYIAAGRNLQVPEMEACGLRIAKALVRWDTVDELLHFALTETYAMPILNDVIDFIAYNLHPEFTLHFLAPELRQHPRLPSYTEPKQLSHNPRLSKIQFGDAPPEDDTKPNHITQVLSSVLLTIPLPLLNQLFSHPVLAGQIGRNGIARLMQDVVDERERRRQKALKAQLRPSPDGTVPQRLLDNLYQQESIERSNERPSGLVLVTNRQSE